MEYFRSKATKIICAINTVIIAFITIVNLSAMPMFVAAPKHLTGIGGLFLLFPLVIISIASFLNTITTLIGWSIILIQFIIDACNPKNNFIVKTKVKFSKKDWIQSIIAYASPIISCYLALPSFVILIENDAIRIIAAILISFLIVFLTCTTIITAYDLLKFNKNIK